MQDIQRLPAITERIETGPIQFGDDWPGVFIRGDRACSYAHALAEIAHQIEDPVSRLQVIALIEDLASCAAGPLQGKFNNIINRLCKI